MSSSISPAASVDLPLHGQPTRESSSRASNQRASSARRSGARPPPSGYRRAPTIYAHRLRRARRRGAPASSAETKLGTPPRGSSASRSRAPLGARVDECRHRAREGPAALRDDDERRPRRHLRHAPRARARGLGGGRATGASTFLDPLTRTSRERYWLINHQDIDGSSTSRPTAAPERRVHARAAQSLGHAHRAPGIPVDARDRTAPCDETELVLKSRRVVPGGFSSKALRWPLRDGCRGGRVGQFCSVVTAKSNAPVVQSRMKNRKGRSSVILNGSGVCQHPRQFRAMVSAFAVMPCPKRLEIDRLADSREP